MATSFVQPILQVFDDYGVILAGGTIETFEAGTSTPLATYQDLEGNVANTNPVVLDSAGRATIRVTNGVAYKFVISDSDGNLIDTLDDIVVGISSDAAGGDVLVTLNYSGTPGAQALMGGAIFDREVTFPIDFEGALGVVLTLPSSLYTISIRKNSVEVGTAVISDTGAWTFATVGSAAVTYSPGDYLTFIAPDSGSAADFVANLTGEAA